MKMIQVSRQCYTSKKLIQSKKKSQTKASKSISFWSNCIITVDTCISLEFSYRRSSPSGYQRECATNRAAGRPVPTLTTQSTQVAQRRNERGRTGQLPYRVRRRLVSRSDPRHKGSQQCCLQLLLVSPLTRKSYQSLQQCRCRRQRQDVCVTFFAGGGGLVVARDCMVPWNCHRLHRPKTQHKSQKPELCCVVNWGGGVV